MIIVNDTDFSFTDTCVTVGKFEALHIGHKALMEKMNAFRSKGLKTVVLRLEIGERKGTDPISRTEDRDTVNISAERDEQSACHLRTEQERIELLEALGIDIYVSIPFTEELAHMSADDFVSDILVKRLGTKAIVVGDDFHFGYKRAGNVELLSDLGLKYGFETVVLDRIRCDGQVVSSTLIRQLIHEKKLDEALRMLG